MRRRRPHASAALALAALALVPAASAHAAGKPKLSVSAHAAKTQLTVRVKATAAGRVAVSVKGSTAGTLGKKTTTLARGKTRTLSFKTTSCKRCTKVDVVGTLTTPGGKPVTSKVAVKLPTTTTTTQTSTTTTAPAPAASTTTTAAAKAPAPTTTTTTTTTTSQADATAAPAATTTTSAGATTVANAAPAAPTTATKLAWAPPKLTNATTVKVTDSNRSLKLDNTKDYIVSMPATPLTGGYGVVITGGHNVVLIGGEIDIPWQGTNPPVNSRRGLYLQGQTGTVHIEGLYIHGADLSEGIDLDQRLGATVQIENVRIDGVHARDEVGFTDNHPDLIQSWAGPNILRVDHLSGSSDYQGFFFAPMQFGSTAPTLFDLRNIDISAVQRNNVFFAGYLLWQSSSFPMSISNLYVVPDAKKTLSGSVYPKTGVWTAATSGTPSTGSFATAAQTGTVYRSAGYATS